MMFLPLSLPLPPADQPVFRRDVLPLRWWRRYRSASVYARHVLLWTLFTLVNLFVLGLSVLYLDNVFGSSSYYSIYSSTLTITGGGYGMIGYGFVFTVGAAFLVDFIIIFRALGLVMDERAAHRWDLLRLTPLGETELLRLKHAAAQARAWRLTALVIAMRVTVLVLLLLLVFGVTPLLPNQGNTGFWQSIGDVIAQEPLASLLLLATSLLFVYVYLMEARWRLRALAAVGLAVSANRTRFLYALLAGFWQLIGNWILQVLIIGFTFYLYISSVTRVTSTSYVADRALSSAASTMLLLLVLCVISAVIIRVYYLAQTRIALASAARGLAR